MERSLGNLRPNAITNGPRPGPSHTGKQSFTPELIQYLWVKSQNGTKSVELPLAGWSDNKNSKNPRDKFFTVEISDPRYSDKNYRALVTPPKPVRSDSATLEEFMNKETINEEPKKQVHSPYR